VLQENIDSKKEEWISAKIAKLINEGKSQEQASAIAFSMYEEEHKDICKNKKDSVERIDYYDYDPSTIFTLTPEGYLTGRASITNIGIFEYRNKDGTTRKEYRPPNEVFSNDSMTSFQHKPITNDHPPEMVDATNYKKYAVGQTGSYVTDNGYNLYIDMTVTDPTTIKAIQSGKTAISSGYRCDLDETPGKELGINYDCVQRNIQGNHVAIVDRARAGDSAKIRMDSVHILSKENTMPENLNLKVIKLDGADFHAEPQVLAELNKQSVRADTAESKVKEVTEQVSKIEADRDNQKERADAAIAELETLKKNHVDADKVSAMVKFRVGLEAVAAKAGVEVKNDSSDFDIMKAVILSKKPKAILEGQNETYIKARYDSIVEDLATESEKNDDAANRSVQGELNNDSEDKKIPNVAAAKQKFIDAQKNAWKKKE